MLASRVQGGSEHILDVVADLLEARGYDGWTLQEVAERAHCSFRTIYTEYGSRDDLIVAAVERWMDRHVYRKIQEQSQELPLFDALVAQFRAIYRPWERHPAMLQVFVRAIATPAGHTRLRAQGEAAVQPTVRRYADLDPEWAKDLGMMIENVVRGAETRYVNGDIPITHILKDIERALFRFSQVTPSAAPARRAARPRTQSIGRRRSTPAAKGRLRSPD